MTLDTGARGGFDVPVYLVVAIGAEQRGDPVPVGERDVPALVELQEPPLQGRLVQPDRLVADLGEVAVVGDSPHVLVAKPLERQSDLVWYRVGEDGVGDHGG